MYAEGYSTCKDLNYNISKNLQDACYDKQVWRSPILGLIDKQ